MVGRKMESSMVLVGGEGDPEGLMDGRDEAGR